MYALRGALATLLCVGCEGAIRVGRVSMRPLTPAKTRPAIAMVADSPELKTLKEALAEQASAERVHRLCNTSRHLSMCACADQGRERAV